MTSSTSLIDCVCMLQATTTVLPGMPSADGRVDQRRDRGKQRRQRGLARDARLPREMRIAHGAEHEVGAGGDAGRAADAIRDDEA